MYKIFHFLFLLVCTASFCQAQIDKGTVFLGGNASFESKDTDNRLGISPADVSSFSYNLHPQVGYFLSKNIAVGLELGFSHARDRTTYSNSIDNTTLKTNRYSVGTFMRFYHFFDSRIGLFSEAKVLYETGSGTNHFTSSEFGPATDKLSTRSFEAGITPGIVFLLNRKFSLEATYGFLGYTYSNTGHTYYKPTTTDQTVNSFGLQFNKVGLGIKYYFAR